MSLIVRSILAVSGICILAGCTQVSTGRQPEIDKGPGAEVTVDGLHRLRHSGFADAWVRPGANFASYSKVLLGPVFVSYKRPPHGRRGTGAGGNFALSESQMEKFKNYLTVIFQEEFGKSDVYEEVSKPGASVLEVEPSIIDLVVSAPVDTPGRRRAYVTSTAQMTLLMELRDSESGELLARIADRQEARASGASGLSRVYYSSPVSNTQAVRSTFRRWARVLVKQLDQVHALGVGMNETSAPQ